MSANVETMMYTREKPWHGLGTMVQEAPTSAAALRLSGLDWTVEQKPIRLVDGPQVESYKANVRSTDGKVLGIVTDRYKIVQNKDAFEFTDSLIDSGDVCYETAGSLNGGKKIWLLAKLPDTELVGDKTEPYLCFSNTHDGSGAIRVCMTPVRVVCNNTLNLALSTARRSWSVRHVGDLASKLHDARMCLDMANKYMDSLAERADRLANTSVTDEEIHKILEEMFPLSENPGIREQNSVERAKDEFMICYFAPDLRQFQGTSWGLLNAMSDMMSHNLPRRQTANYWENNWGRIMDGHAMMDKLATLVPCK